MAGDRRALWRGEPKLRALVTPGSCGVRGGTCRWGCGGNPGSAQASSSNVLGTSHRPCSGLGARSVSLLSALLSTQWLLEPSLLSSSFV